MSQIFAYITQKDGVLDDSAAELAMATAKIEADTQVTAVVTGAGSSLDAACQAAAGIYPKVWKFDNAELAYPDAEMIRKLLINVVPAGSIFLLAHDTFGMDLGPGLAVKLKAAYVADVVGIEAVEANKAILVRQEYAGMAHTHVNCDFSGGAVLTLRPGTFQAGEGGGVGGQVQDKSGEIKDLSTKRRFVEVVQAETGDVDITKADVLVSIGRGIEDQENIELADELAEAMGTVVSCSRPIVDAKWLEKTRQVGTSGKTVKPKVYMALGISGSFQHMGGLKGSPFIVAVNKNPKAPIFQVADVGIVEDILEFMPELTEKIQEG
jgi:electron transfer flavoprotein alpha subunit